MAEVWQGERDTSLVIDTGTRGNFYAALDIVREGIKRMLNNHEFNPTVTPEIVDHIQFLDWLASEHVESIKRARRILASKEE